MEETIQKKIRLALSCFIVPNSIRKIGYCTISDVGGTHIWDMNLSEMERLSHFRFTPIRGARYIEVWIHNPAEGSNSNWTDHGIPQEYLHLFDYDQNERYAHAPNLLPMKFLLNKKEGDEVTLRDDHRALITLKFEQLPYRYSRFGKFEEVVDKLLKKYNDEEEDSWHKMNGEFIPMNGKNGNWPWAMDYVEKD